MWLLLAYSLRRRLEKLYIRNGKIIYQEKRISDRCLDVILALHLKECYSNFRTSSDRFTRLLKTPQWFFIDSRVMSKLFYMTFKALQNLVPKFLFGVFMQLLPSACSPSCRHLIEFHTCLATSTRFSKITCIFFIVVKYIQHKTYCFNQFKV